MAFQANDDVNAVLNGNDNDPNVIKAKLNAIFARWGRPQVQTSDVPDSDLVGAGSDGGTQGFRQSQPVPGASEQSSGSADLAQPRPASQPINLERAGHVPRSLQPAAAAPAAPDTSDAHLVPLAKQLVASGAPIPGASAEPGSTADLESRVPFGGSPDSPNIPPVITAAAKSAQPGGVLGVLKGIGSFAAKQILPRVGMAGYAISGGDPYKLRLAQEQQKFEEEQANREYGLEQQKVGLQSRSVDIEQQRADTEAHHDAAMEALQQQNFGLAQREADRADKSLAEEIRYHQQEGDLEQYRIQLESKQLEISLLSLKAEQQRFDQQMAMESRSMTVQEINQEAEDEKALVLAQMQKPGLWTRQSTANKAAADALKTVEQKRLDRIAAVTGGVPSIIHGAANSAGGGQSGQPTHDVYDANKRHIGTVVNGRFVPDAK
jgi:hypothetical protein